MALIKKYNTGGSFADYLREGLASGKIKATNKSYAELQRLAQDFNPPEVQEGKAEKNWAGYYKAETPETAATALAEIYKNYEASKQNVTEVPIIPEGGWGQANRSIGSLLDNIVKKKFGGNRDYAVDRISKMKDNDEVKKFVFDNAVELLDSYSTAAKASPGDFWKGLDDVDYARQIISTIKEKDGKFSDEDWDKFRAVTDKLGFAVDDFLISDETLKQREEAAKAKQTEQDKKGIYDSYRSSGITDENLMSQLYSAGLTRIADDFNPYLTEYFRNKGYTVYTDKDGKNYGVLKDGTLVESDKGIYTEDQFSDDYGKTWQIKGGLFGELAPGTIPEGLELPQWQDEGNIRRRLIPLTDGTFDFRNSDWAGWTIYGDSNEQYGEYGKDLFQRRDYTSAITLTNPTTKKSIRAYKQSDGSYKTEDGRVLPKFKFAGFGKEFEKIAIDPSKSLFKSPEFHHLGWGNIKANDPNDWWEKFIRRTDRGTARIWGIELGTQQLEQDISNFQAELTAAKAQNRAARIKPGKVKELMERAAYFYESGTPEQREWAASNFNKINEILATVDSQGNRLFQFKDGGVVKFQSGSVLEQATAANRKFSQPVKGELNPITGRTESPKGISGLDLTTRLKDASGLQIASLAATGLSFVPGVGVIGGTASTIFDAIEGAKDGWDKKDTMNLLGNIGFTILAGVGLGAVKGGKLAVSAARAGKLAKGADKVGDTTKLAKQAFNQANKAIKTLESSGKLGKETSEALKIAKRVSEVAGKGKIPNAKDLAVVEDLAKIKTTWLGSKTAGLAEAVKYPVEFVKNKAPVIGKVGKWGLIGQAGITGASGALDIGKNIVEEGSIIGGIANTDIDSIRKATQLGALGRIRYMNKKQSSDIGKHITMKGSSKSFSTVTIGDKQIKVSGVLDKGKLFRQSDRREFLTNLKARASKDDVALIDKLLENKKISRIKVDFTDSKGGIPILNKPKDLVGYEAKRSYERAKRMHEKGYANYASPRRWFADSVEPNTQKFVTPKNLKAIKNAKTNSPKNLGKRSVKVTNFTKKDFDAQTFLSKTQNTNDKTAKAVREALEKHFGGLDKVPKSFKPANLNMKHDPKGLYKSLINHTLPKKQQGGILKLKDGNIVYNDKTVNVGQYERKRKSDYTLPYTPIGKVSNWQYNNGQYTQQYLDFANKIDDNFFSDNRNTINTFIDKQGGGYKPTSASDLKRLMLDGKYGPIHNWALEYLQNNVQNTSTPSLSSTRLTYTPPTIPELKFQSPYVTNSPYRYQIPGITAGQSGTNPNAGTSTEGSGRMAKVFQLQPFNKDKYHNWGPLWEGARYLAATSGNRAYTNKAVRAVSEIPYLETLTHTYLETGMPYTNLAQHQAAEVVGRARRIADSTSDFDKGAAVRLQANDQAARLALEGQYKDMERNDKIIGHQAIINSKVDEYNANIMNKNRALGSDARMKTFQLYANQDYMNNLGLQNYLGYLGREHSLHPYKKAMWNYQQAGLDPNLQEAYKYQAYLDTDLLDKYKLEYDDWVKGQKALGYSVDIPTFEKSQMYEEYTKQKERLSRSIQPIMDRYLIAQRAAQAAVPLAQKGGRLSFEERVALENVKYNHKRLLQNERLFYKQLMENKKLVQKALIKVFK